MKKSLTISTIYFLTFCLLFGVIEASKKEHVTSEEKVKYVQGGACGKGKGTKEHPYTSLAQAQADTSWETLIVLPSTVALDGGITLRSGTKLIGTEDPTGIALLPTQPTITNSSAALNGGNGVIVTGDAVIENIYFKDTWASGIRYDDAHNLCVRQVLITGYNQGNVLSPANASGLPPYEIAAIHGQIKNSGKTSIKRVVIRNNHTGSGILEQVYGGAQRELKINSCECAELASSNLISSFNVFTTTGMVGYAIGEGTQQTVTITNAYLHDFLNNARAVDPHGGIGIFSTNGGTQIAHISDSTITNLATEEQNTSFEIFSEAFVPGSSEDSGIRSVIKITIDNCSLEERPGNASAGIEIETDNSTMELVVKDSRITNISDCIVSFIGGDSTQKETIVGNTASGSELFYAASSENFRGSFPNAQRFTDVTIKDNFYTGGDALGGITVLPNLDGSATPWDRLAINANNNCLDGQGSGTAGLLGLDFGTAGAGNATINAHNNSIVGYFFDIADFFANVNYFAQRNFWGQGDPCATGADCASTQICENGFCVGPDNVLNLGTCIVNVTNPLRQPIICPQSFCVHIGTSPSQPGVAATDRTALEERINKLKAKLKSRFQARK